MYVARDADLTASVRVCGFANAVCSRARPYAACGPNTWLYASVTLGFVFQSTEKSAMLFKLLWLVKKLLT